MPPRAPTPEVFDRIRPALLLVAAAALAAASSFAVSDDFLGVDAAADAGAALAAARGAGEWSRAGWLAVVYAGDETLARELFAQALAADADDEAALEGVAWLDFGAGKMQPSFDAWRHYLDLYPGGDATPAFAAMIKLFDGVVPAYAEVADFLLARSARGDCPPASRDAMTRAAEAILPQLGRWDDAAALATRQGYLGPFAVCGIFHKYGLVDIDTPFAPEERLSAAPPVTAGDAAWRTVAPAYGAVDVGAALGRNMGTAYAVTTFELPAGQYLLEITSDDWYRAWLGGTAVATRHPRAGGPAIVRAPFATAGGRQRLLVKSLPNNDAVLNTDGKWGFKIRVLRADTEQPVAAACEPTWEGDAVAPAQIPAAPPAPAAAEGAGPMADFYRGLRLFTVGDGQAGVEAIDAAAARAPACVIFYIVGAYGRILVGGEYNLADAKAQLRRARAEDPDCVLATEELAVFASFEGKRDEAVDFYRQSLAAEPAYVSSVCGLAEIAAREQWDAEMLRGAEAALKLNPAAHRAWRLLADYYYDKDNTAAAAEYYRRYLALKADDVDARLNLAEADLFLGQADDARAQYETLLRLAPEREEGYLGMADTAARAGDDAGARAWLERGAAALPRSAEVRRQWGYYLCGHGDRDRGLAVLKEALALDVSDFRLRAYLEREGALAPDAVSAALSPPPDAMARAAAVTAEKYPHADTVMLLDQTVVYLNDDFSLRESNHNLIKILNDKGRERWGEITVMSDPGTEILQARTLLPTGETVDAVSIKDTGDYKVISMEQVVPGAVLEVAYDLNVNRRMIFNLLDFYSQSFYMQELGEALLTTRYAVVVDDAFPARDRLHFDVRFQKLGAKKVRGAGRTAYVFERRDMPAVVEEPMMPSKDAFAPYVRVSTLRDVASLAEWYRGEMWGALKMDGFLRRRLAAVGAVGDDAARAAAVYYDVVRGVESNGGTVYYPAPARLTAFRGRGRPVDRAVLICAFCRELGIPAKIALVGTGGSKKEWDFITPDMFDTVLVYFPTIGKGGTYADPLLKNVRFGDVWAAAYDKPALLIDEAGYEISRIPPAPFEKDSIGLELALEMDAGGGGRFTGRRLYRGLRGAYRESFTNPEERESNVEISLSQVFSAATIEDFGFEHLTDSRGDFALNFTGRVPSYARVRGDKLALPAAPYPYSLAGIFITSEKRMYPLRIERPEAWTDDVTVTLPAGFDVKNLPAPVKLAGPLSQYELACRLVEGKLVVTRRLFINQGDVQPKEYGAFVKFCREVDQAEKAEVVLGPRGREPAGDKP